MFLEEDSWNFINDVFAKYHYNEFLGRSNKLFQILYDNLWFALQETQQISTEAKEKGDCLYKNWKSGNLGEIKRLYFYPSKIGKLQHGMEIFEDARVEDYLDYAAWTSANGLGHSYLALTIASYLLGDTKFRDAVRPVLLKHRKYNG